MATDAGGTSISEYIFIGQVSSYGSTPGTVTARPPHTPAPPPPAPALMPHATRKTKHS